jgi:lysophospholipase L1-like esterase
MHNAEGFRRSTDVERAKPSNGYRIFLMGGSAAYGISAAPPYPPVLITNEKTIDHKLEALLGPLFPGLRIEVINAATTAYWTHHHLIYLHEQLLDWAPDLVIFFDGINDYYHTRADHRQFLSYRYSMTLAVDTLNAPGPSDVARALLGWGRRYSNAVFVLDELVRRALRWDEAPEDPCEAESIPPEQLNAEFTARYLEISRRTWVRTLRSILMLLNDQGVPAITTLQPELIFPQSAGLGDGDRALLDLERSLRPRYYSEKKRFLLPITRRLAAETAEKLDATFVDLTDVFDDRAQYFIDYCHLSEAGATRVAERLLPHVRAAIERGGHA